MTRAALVAAIEAVENAKEGSRELSDTILLACGWRDDYGRWYLADSPTAPGITVPAHDRPDPSQSLAAALTLVPLYRTIDGKRDVPMVWGVGPLSDDLHPERKFCALCRRRGIRGDEPLYDAGHSTPALALCLAALRARLAILDTIQ